ncbi:MAG TPA: hypothetical protein VEX64_10380, partial [Pyrinomonadaceae bacterium]|nr:hypothetical protein [Pyrinomonadaceae bacterium]
MRSNFILLILLVSLFVLPIAAQNKTQIVAANGQSHPVAGKDRQRKDEEIVVFTPEYYKKNPTFKNGVDVYLVNGKVAVIQDRAGAVYIQNKPDPGAIAVEKDGVVLSANGAARKWVLANLKVGDAVTIGEVVVQKNAAG